MAKLTLTDLASLTNETSAITTINNNNDAIEQAMEKTLTRDGTSPNSLSAQLDMNTHKIINLDKGTATGEALEYSQLQEKVDDIELIYNQAVTAKNQAQAAQAAAELAESGAKAAEDEAEDILADIQIIYDQYNNQFLGTFTGDPTVDNKGNPLTVGDIYYNSVLLSMRVWDGTVWQDIAAMTPTSNNEISNKIYINPVFRGTFLPETDDGVALGSTTKEFSDLFLAAGAVINFNAGNYTITHSAGLLNFSGSGQYGNTLFVSGGYAGAYSGGSSSLKLGGGGSSPDGAAIGWGDGSGWKLNLGYNNSSTFTPRYTFTDTGAFYPSTNDGAVLGTASFNWSDLFLATGAIIDFGNNNIRITHAANRLNFTGGSNGYYFSHTIAPTANDGAPLGSAAVSWADLFLATGAVINFNSGDVTITHSTNSLAFAGASSGYSFDAKVSRDPSFFFDIATDPYIYWDTNDSLSYSRSNNAFFFTIGGSNEVVLSATNLMPGSNDGNALGSSSFSWADLFLASGAVVNFNNGDYTLTHSTGILTASGDIRISSPGTNSASVVTVSGSQTLTNKTLTSPVISTIVNTGTLTLPTATSTILSSTGNVNLTGGFTATSYSNGTVSSGTLTPSGLNGNFQHYTANGAHTLAPPSTTASIILECLNGASAGAITTSGFTKVTGDTYSTTNTYKFLFFITKSNSYSHLHIQALQ